MSKYTPTHYALQEVQRVNSIPTDPEELLTFIMSLRDKHGATVQIVPSSNTETQYSMRGDGTFTTTVSYFSIQAEVPVYSEADRNAMHRDMQAEVINRVQNLFKASESSWMTRNGYPTDKK